MKLTEEFGSWVKRSKSKYKETKDFIVCRLKEQNSEKLQNEYAKLVQGLQSTATSRETDVIMANPTLPDDLLLEAVPGNIRRAEHFVAFLRRFIEYLKVINYFENIVYFFLEDQDKSFTRSC